MNRGDLDFDDSAAAAVASLAPARRADLTGGANGWSTLPAPEIGLAAMLMGDGPLGLVSATFDERETALLLPCGTALGATWDRDLVRSVAELQGAEARSRGYAAVYTPNLNLARTGLSGRTFEMYSEDPVLAGLLGAAFVIGLQSQGVASCPKHLVANDTETQRQSMSATVDDVTLREVYLRSFELALLDGDAWMVMTAYNRLNGLPCAANSDLLAILKDEWGWDGLIVSDYFALKETVGPALAGLDLEMPGPAIHFGPRLAEAVNSGAVPQARVDDSVLRLMRLASRVGAVERATADGAVAAQQLDDDAATSVLTAAAAASFVLVKNDGGLLPLDPGGEGSLAVIGPNALRPTFQGATFGRVRPSGIVVSPLEAIRNRFGGDVVHEPGVAPTVPETLGAFAVRTPDGTPGILVEHVDADGAVILTEVRADSSFVWFGTVPGVGPTTEPGSIRLTAVVTPEASGIHEFGAGGSGQTTLQVDGQMLTHRPAPSPQDVMGQVARAEMSLGRVDLVAGVPTTIEVEMRSTGDRVRALIVGWLPPQSEDALERALEAASAVDTVVLVVGDALQSSRESRDLDSSALPPGQVELIRRVAATLCRTVVVVNAGRPVDAPWADDVDAVVYVWLPGQQFGPALAAALAGEVEPSGRMPVTVTMHDQDRSTWGEKLDADLTLDYTTTEPTGYRHLHRTGVPPRFAFGAGLGYTTWRHDTASAAVNAAPDVLVEVRVGVTNVGGRAGREVVQIYGRGPGEVDARLYAFEGVHLDAGESAEVVIGLSARDLSRWDTSTLGWKVPSGRHDIIVGRSAVEVTHVISLDL